MSDDTYRVSFVPMKRRWWQFWLPRWREEMRVFQPSKIGKGRHPLGARVRGVPWRPI